MYIKQRQTLVLAFVKKDQASVLIERNWTSKEISVADLSLLLVSVPNPPLPHHITSDEDALPELLQVIITCKSSGSETNTTT